MSLLDLQSSSLVRLLQRTGPRATSSIEACKDMLSGIEPRDMSYSQVSSALLYMVITQNGGAYDPQIFVSALRQHRSGQRIDWQDVFGSFDRDNLKITKQQFLALFNALLPVARDYENLDIQSLWGGNTWSNLEAQLSFVVAFLSCSPSEIDASQIPRLRTAFSVQDFEDASEEVKAYAAKAVRHPMVSLEATRALFGMIFQSQETYNHAQSLGIPENVINANTDIFVCAASAVEKPWAPLQEQALKQLFYPFFLKSLPNYSFVLHALWKHDKPWLASRLLEAYSQNPMFLTLIFEHAQEHGWVEELLQISNDFGLDFAALAHSHGLVDLDEWATEILQVPSQTLARAISQFLRIKADDDATVQREQVPPATVPLKLRSVYALLNLIHGSLSDEEIAAIERHCIGAYPRLINYGGPFDSILDANSEGGHALSPEADAKMQEQYKLMYGNEVDPRGMVETLQNLKESEDPADQDLFACMIHGLFDEYNCFGEYPLEALATTAVLFGGIISYGVLTSRITLGVALFMVYEAVEKFGPEDSMYKFGLQAAIHFQNRLDEWPSFCDRLIRIPGIRGTEVYTKAEEVVLREAGHDLSGGEQAERALTNGDMEGFGIPDPSELPFTSIHVDPPLRSDLYETPDEDTSDKVMFVLNNVSKRNLEEKFKDLQDALEGPHHQWFAHYLVEDLAKAQPNFQGLYLQILDLFNQKQLWQEVLRETYASVAKILNAESTMQSSTERSNLKNLAVWLGLLTLARNQPILHRNISFKDLLIEAHHTQRLIVAIPFTCKVLAQAAHSKIFRPPNPWLMELIGVLIELYQTGELKLNLKFEIEVLCKELDLDHKTIEPATVIRSLPSLHEIEYAQSYAPEGIDGFGDMHLMGLSKRGPNERFLPQDVLKSLPDLGQLLHYPPSPSNVSQLQLKQIFLSAAQQAITEIIAPVVERSVTIAAISTSQLVEKDFAMESDSERVQASAHTVVKALSGSLALVTCKEPLRMSIMNNIRKMANQHLPEQLPEGSILMFVNDNLDTVCKMVEDAAESQSMAEIDAQIEESVERRRRHRETRPNEPFNHPPVSRWAFYIPEPYKQELGGLNPQQLAIYEEFGRQMRLPSASHTNNTSQDSNRQLPDVLTDSYLPSLPTPAEAPAMPRTGAQQQQQQQQQQRLQAPIGIQSPQVQPQTNGYVNEHNINERVTTLLADIQRSAREAPEEHIRELGPSAPTKGYFEELLHLVEASISKDQLSLMLCERATSILYTDAKSRLEIEVLVRLLVTLCNISVYCGRQLVMYLSTIEDDDRVFNAAVTDCLLATGLVDLHHIDVQIARAFQQRRPVALDFLSSLMDEILLNEHPGALRADFVLSFGTLSQWLAEEPSNEKAKEIMNKLQAPAQVPNGLPSPPGSEKQDQLEYVFEEWVRLLRPDTPERSRSAFINQLQSRDIIKSREDLAEFIRICIESSVDAYEREATSYGTLDNAYLNVDALAKLIVCLIMYQGGTDSAMQGNRATSLEAILCVVVLVANHHHNVRQERFNAKVFFRLFSSILCEIHLARPFLDGSEQELSLVMGRAFLALQPGFFPGFTFSWLTLIGHRLFVPSVLRANDQKVKISNKAEMKNELTSVQGSDLYTEILKALFTQLGEIMNTMEHTPFLMDFYRGTFRLILLLQHDYPDFLTENHLQLISSIPTSLLQMQNVINSAHPASFQDLPDPFTPGLKINRLDQVRQTPHIRGDLSAILAEAGIKTAVDNALAGKEPKLEDIKAIATGIDPAANTDATASLTPPSVDTLLINGLVLHVGNIATVASSSFSAAAPSAKVLEGLVGQCRPEVSYQLICAMTNQVRYPSSHTHYFSTALLHLFTTGTADLQQQIARVLVERLMVARPHPWGIIVTVLELVKNQAYNIWDLEWMKAAPEVERMLLNVAHSQGVAQSPRVMM